MSNLTIRDIARMAGVSTTAVSFVLNNRSGVSDATREKIQEVIRRTGFTPNAHTRRLTLGKSFTIHVVLRHYGYSLYNQFAQETLSGIFKASRALGYSLMFTFVDDDMGCDQVMDAVRSKDCDGVILNQVSDPAIIALLSREQIPFICVDAHVDKDGSLPLVDVDYYDAAYQATMFLHSYGHKDIGFIVPTTPASFYISAFGGYTAALKDASLICNPNWLFEIPFFEASAEACIGQLLEQTALPTAFLCAGDSIAIDAIRCAKARGLRIPEDISIMSIDDLLVSRYLDPPLSTMTFDKEQLGQMAVDLLFRIMQGQPYQPVNLIKTTPIPRGTVKRIG